MDNWRNICKYTVISSLIFCIQIVCEFDFFNKLLIIIKFPTSVNSYNLKQLLSFVIFEIICTYFVGDLCHGRWFRFSTCTLFASFVFSTKGWSISNSPNINKTLLFKVVAVFCYFFRFSHMYIVCWELIPWKKCFTSVSLIPFTKN